MISVMIGPRSAPTSAALAAHWPARHPFASLSAPLAWPTRREGVSRLSPTAGDRTRQDTTRRDTTQHNTTRRDPTRAMRAEQTRHSVGREIGGIRHAHWAQPPAQCRSGQCVARSALDSRFWLFGCLAVWLLLGRLGFAQPASVEFRAASRRSRKRAPRLRESRPSAAQ